MNFDRQHNGRKRIWPFSDLFGVFSHEVILAENEQRAIDSEAVLAHRDGVVEGHCAGSLRHRLLIHSLPPRSSRWSVAVPMSVAMSMWPTLPAAAAAPGAPSSTGPPNIPARHLISEPRHSADTDLGRQSSLSSG